MISVVCVYNNESLLRDYLVKSLHEQTVDHELIALDNTKGRFTSAAAALNLGATRAKGKYIIFVHQDVTFPPTWLSSILDQIAIVDKVNAQWGVLGLMGVTAKGSWAGHIIDRYGHLHLPPLPCEVQSLDEVCLVVRKDSSLFFDEQLGGFHFYAADLCLQAATRHLPNFAIDACVHHLGRGTRDAAFWNAADALCNKWRHRQCPVAVIETTCGVFRLRPGFRAWLQYGFRYCSRHLRLYYRHQNIPQSHNGTTSSMSTACGDVCRAATYFEHFRRDALAVVPPDAKCVLSVGCAGGITEAELVKQGVRVVGVELNPKAAAIARQRGLTILEGDASVIDISQVSDSFDCLIYADILEHLIDPVSLLKRHIKSLKPGGIVYVSIPNFRHYSVLWQLFILGHIRYKDAGILDRAHLRITTRKMVLDWFDQLSLRLCSCTYIIHRRRNKLMSALLLGLAREFIASQVSLVGRKG